jgi:hypothetical protein
MSRGETRVAHWSVRPCQYAPSCMRSYSSRLTHGSNVVPSMLRRPAASTLGRSTPPHRHRDRAGHGGAGLTGVVVDTLVGLGHHGALAAAAVGEHEHRDRSGDERAEQGPSPDYRQTPARRCRPDGSPMVTAASSRSSHQRAGQSAATLMPFATDRNRGPEPTRCRPDGRLANPRLGAPGYARAPLLLLRPL